MLRSINIITGLVFILMVFLFSGCSDEEEYEEAIRWYHFTSSKYQGAGAIKIESITILEDLKRSDTTFVLAKVNGYYHPPALTTDRDAEYSSDTLWYIIIRTEGQNTVVGIRDPKEYKP